jgi:hypothetical protein
MKAGDKVRIKHDGFQVKGNVKIGEIKTIKSLIFKKGINIYEISFNDGCYGHGSLFPTSGDSIENCFILIKKPEINYEVY